MIHRRPAFAPYARISAVLYLAFLLLALLYPFAFSSPFASRENSVAWREGEGARFGRSGMLVGAAPPADLYRRLTAGDGLTVEVWLRSASADQEGPARILSYSLNPWERNFTLGQDGGDLVMRLRMARTDANGQPSVEAEDVIVPGRMQHVVVTYDFAEERIYVDGRLRAESAEPRGGFEGWDPSHFLVFGNEASGGRPWNGAIAYAAIYDRPLGEAAVAARYADGPRSGDAPAGARPVVAYDFARGLQGLESPDRVATDPRLFFLYYGGTMYFGATSAWDLMRNVILFVPFGILAFAVAERRAWSASQAVLMAVTGAVLVSGACEALQYFQDTRTSSILDVGTNALGALLGATGIWRWHRRDERGSAASVP